MIPRISGKVSARTKPLFFRYLDLKKQMHDSPTITMVEGKYKFLTNLSESGEEDLLFNLVADRAETKNLVANNPARAQSMKKRINSRDGLLPARPAILVPTTMGHLPRLNLLMK